MTKKERLTVIAAFGKNYRKGKKKVKTEILNKLGGVTGYHRKYLLEILKHPVSKKKIRRYRPSKYLSVLRILKKLWAVSNYACGQRLVPMIPVYLEALERFKEITIRKWERKLLLAISPATLDRLLVHDRKRINIKGRSRTKPGSLLKHQIAIKTWADWDNTTPGFVEIDSVHHCGSSLFGDYVLTLDVVDVATGWNECRGHLGKSERYTLEALQVIRERLPFPLLGIDFDCGGEFVNYHLIRYCQREKITYTRARETIKNDQPYVEQQNYSIVRRYAGYARLDTWEQLTTVNELYEKLSDYQNFFQSISKLKEKIRDGAKVTRRYYKAQTAYQRILARPDISEETKAKLTQRFLTINPKKLILEITALGRKLVKNR